jgi:hypothetical protein
MSQTFPDAFTSKWSDGPFTALQHKGTYSVEINELKGKKAKKTRKVIMSKMIRPKKVFEGPLKRNDHVNSK